MASNDILTQLQTCYDQLLNQFYCTISYLSQRHPTIAPDPIPGEPYTNYPLASANGDSNISPTAASRYAVQPGPEDTDPQRNLYPLRPDSPNTFAQSQKELAEDLVLQCQQIEFLVSRLPGIEKNEDQQAAEITQLAAKVKDMEETRKKKKQEMRALVKRLDAVVMGMATNIKYS